MTSLLWRHTLSTTISAAHFLCQQLGHTHLSLSFSLYYLWRCIPTCTVCRDANKCQYCQYPIHHNDVLWETILYFKLELAKTSGNVYIKMSKKYDNIVDCWDSERDHSWMRNGEEVSLFCGFFPGVLTICVAIPLVKYWSLSPHLIRGHQHTNQYQR